MSRTRFARRQAFVRSGLGGAGVCLAAAASCAPAMAADPPPARGKGDPDVVVTGRRPGITALTETVLNTPQSINVLTHQLLQQQAVTTLQEALKNVPGVTLNSGEGGSHGDTINLRGFPAADDFFLDGLRDTGFYTRDPFNLDAIEVFKGPASTLFGRGSTGGVVNQVSKVPTVHNFAQGLLTLGTNDEQRGTIDANYAISDTAALRINAMAQHAAVTDRDFVTNNRWGFAPTLALGIGTANRLTVSWFHQDEDNVPDYGIPFVGTRPAPVNRSNYYGLPEDDRFQAKVDVGTLKFVHDFNDNLSFTETARLGDYGFNSRETAPHYDPGGIVPPPTNATPLGSILIYRDRPSVQGAVYTAMSESALTWRVQTGPLNHTVVAGFDVDKETAALVRFTNQISSGLTVPPNTSTATLTGPTFLVNPNPFQPFPGHQTAVRQRPTTETDTLAGFLLDSIDIGQHWNVVGAIRFDNFRASFTQPLGAASHFQHTDNVWSPRAALVYKPTPNQSYYLSYGTSFDPSAENLSLSASNAALGPEKDTTYEAGFKILALKGRLSFTGAIFQTEMTNARVADPDNPSLQALEGDLRVRGLELGVQGYLTDKWEILAGYSYLDGRTVSSSAAANVGAPLQNTAPNQANIWTVYEFTEDFSVGTGLNYLDRRPADMAGTVFIPSYVTWDAMARYRLNRHVTVQVNAYNLTDALYYTNAYDTSPLENHIVPGPGRTVMVSLGFSY